ncbi:MAG: PorT family protein [Bacteroidia bacterium]|nr:PorT family protein [Bacteroidia bacterium]
MRRLIALTAALIFANADLLTAQKVELGLQFSPGFAWLKPSDKELKNDGMKPGFNYGVNVDIMFSDNYGIGTGVLMSHQGGKLIALDTIKTSYKFQYLDLPVLLKMRTGEIGYIRYYGTFGVVPGFRLSAKGEVAYGGKTYDEVDIKDQINLLNLSLAIGGGVQYILSGTTRLVGGIEFNNGFSDLLKAKDQKATSSKLKLIVGVMF